MGTGCAGCRWVEKAVQSIKNAPKGVKHVAEVPAKRRDIDVLGQPKTHFFLFHTAQIGVTLMAFPGTLVACPLCVCILLQGMVVWCPLPERLVMVSLKYI